MVRTCHIMWMLFLTGLLGSCAPGPLEPRLSTYFKIDEGSHRPGTARKSQVPRELGLVVVSDSSVPGLTPALPNSMLSLLGNRVSHFMQDQFKFTMVPLTTGKPKTMDQGLKEIYHQAREKNLQYFLAVTFSSVETESATHLGAQPIMTQLPGMTIENTALAELALVHRESRSIVLQVDEQASESMDELTVPLGSDSDVKETDARSILRANAAQLALDRALYEFKKKWNQLSS